MFRRRPEPGPSSGEQFANEVLTHLEPMYGTALRLTRNRADAEDLVQDTVVKALRFAARFEAGTNLRAWLYTILHNTWRNRRRDASREPVDVDSARVEAQADTDGSWQAGAVAVDTPEQILLRGTMDADLQAALDALPEVFREAVWLRDVEEFSYAEIAQMLDIAPGTVMSRISRGRRQLLERLTMNLPEASTGPTGVRARR